MQETFFPEEFIQKYKKYLGKEWPTFFDTIKQKQPKSFWINTNKSTMGKVVDSLSKKKVVFKQYDFCRQAFSIDMQKPGDLEEYKKGEIALQEKAAMLPVVVLGASKRDFVLDACASPGMKTIQLSNLAGKVIATDVNSERTKSLIHNKFAYGLRNVEVIRSDFRNLKKVFDKILLDAPCSSEGLVRKRKEALKGWSQKIVLQKAKTQKNLIISAFDMLKEKGTLVYSTCSFAQEENEDIVNFLLGKRENATVEKVYLPGIKIRENELCKNCVRLYPQDNNTQQFFFAKIKKN